MGLRQYEKISPHRLHPNEPCCRTIHMNQPSRLFSYIQQGEAPEHVRRTILARIEQYRKRNARISLAVSSSALLISGVAFVKTTLSAWSSFSSSGAVHYFSLAFSDTSLISQISKDFLYLTLESLPTMALLSVGISVFCLILFGRSTLLTLKENFPSKRAPIKIAY